MPINLNSDCYITASADIVGYIKDQDEWKRVGFMKNEKSESELKEIHYDYLKNRPYILCVNYKKVDAFSEKIYIEKVIFNEPATIVLWSDGSKTVVKCKEGEEFDPDVGLAMCICKRQFGDAFHYIFRKYTEQYWDNLEEEEDGDDNLQDYNSMLCDSMRDIFSSLSNRK